MALVNMARSKKERKREARELAVEGDQSKFPWGLSITLDDESLTKLGIKKLPDVGDKMSLTAVASVESVSENKNVNRKNRDVRLQIEKLEVKRGEFKSAVDAVDAAMKDA